MIFNLHPNLEKKIVVTDLSLCTVLMENEKQCPWFLLVPRRPNLLRLIDLNYEDQLKLYKELDCVQKVIWEEFKPNQLNVAAIGNKTPQLHIHVIARYENDPAWPHTVWDHPVRTPYENGLELEVAKKIGECLTRKCALV